jgi:hypothetical protein
MNNFATVQHETVRPRTGSASGAPPVSIREESSSRPRFRPRIATGTTRWDVRVGAALVGAVSRARAASTSPAIAAACAFP